MLGGAPFDSFSAHESTTIRMTEPSQTGRHPASASRLPAEVGELRFLPLEADTKGV